MASVARIHYPPNACTEADFAALKLVFVRNMGQNFVNDCGETQSLPATMLRHAATDVRATTRVMANGLRASLLWNGTWKHVVVYPDNRAIHSAPLLLTQAELPGAVAATVNEADASPRDNANGTSTYEARCY